MKESYSEVLARHAGPESYADRGNTLGVATAGVHAGPVLSSVNRFIPCADVVQTAEGNIVRALMASTIRARRSRRPGACMETPSARTGRSHRLLGGDVEDG